MGDVSRRAESPPSIWQLHEDILQANVSGDAVLAQASAEKHIDLACVALTDVLESHS